MRLAHLLSDIIIEGFNREDTDSMLNANLLLIGVLIMIMFSSLALMAFEMFQNHKKDGRYKIWIDRMREYLF
jgi:hypothetical protein